MGSILLWTLGLVVVAHISPMLAALYMVASLALLFT